jgi:cysteine desulfuration protein SufE
MALPIAYESFVAALDAIDNEEERLTYVIDLGRRHAAAAFPQAWKTGENRMHGCLAAVWVVDELKHGRHWFRGHSDAVIVNGLIAIMTASFSGLTATEIEALTLDRVRRFDLGALTAQRQVGLMAMLKHFQKLAKRKEQAEMIASAWTHRSGTPRWKR